MSQDLGSKRGMDTGRNLGSMAPMGISERSNNPEKGNTPGPLQSVGEQNKMAGKAGGVGKDKRMS